MNRPSVAGNRKHQGRRPRDMLRLEASRTPGVQAVTSRRPHDRSGKSAVDQYITEDRENRRANGSRKFILTAFVAAAGTAALFAGKLDQGGYVTLMALCLSIYGAANVVDKKLEGAR